MNFPEIFSLSFNIQHSVLGIGLNFDQLANFDEMPNLMKWPNFEQMVKLWPIDQIMTNWSNYEQITKLKPNDTNMIPPVQFIDIEFRFKSILHSVKSAGAGAAQQSIMHPYSYTAWLKKSCSFKVNFDGPLDP